MVTEALGRDRRRSRLWRIVAMTTVCLVGALGMIITPSAQAAETTAPSAAEAQVVDLGLLGIDLADLGYARSDYPQGAQFGHVDVGLLNDGINIDLGGIDIPLVKNAEAPGARGLLNLANVGLLRSYGEATSPNWGRASSGVLTDDGALALTQYENGSLQNSSIDLTQLLTQLGLAGALGVVIDRAEIEIGAVGSEMTVGNLTGSVEDCVFYVDSEYIITDLQLDVESPVVGGLVSTITAPNGVISDVSATLNVLVGEGGAIGNAINGVLAPIETLLNGLNLGVARVEAEVGVGAVMLDTAPILAEVQHALSTRLESGDGSIWIDLSTGEIRVDLAHYVVENYGVNSLNELDPNTPVLDANTVNAILNGITDLLVGDPAAHPNSLVAKILDAVELGIYKSHLDISLGVELKTCVVLVGCELLIDAPITIDGLLGGFLGIEDLTEPGGERLYPEPVIDASALELLELPLSVALQPVVNLLTGLVTTIGSLLDAAIFDAGTGVLAVLQESLVGDDGVLTVVVNSLIGTSSSPGVLRTLLDDAVALTINRQPAEGDLGPDSHTVSALEIVVLPFIDAIPLRLATSTAKATAPVCLTLTKEVSQASQFEWATQAQPTDWNLSASITGYAVKGISGAEAVTQRPVPQGVYTLGEQVGVTGITGGLPAHAYESEWQCLGPDGQPVEVDETSINLSRPAGQTDAEPYEVVCQVTNTLITAAATWNKVSAANPTLLLSGSEWRLHRTSAPLQHDIDVAQHMTPAAAGVFEITGLPVGEYQLVEETSPIGYRKLTEPIDFEVLPDGTTTLVSDIENAPVAMPALPLSGGVGTHLYLLAGIGAVIVALIVSRRGLTRSAQQFYFSTH